MKRTFLRMLLLIVAINFLPTTSSSAIASEDDDKLPNKYSPIIVTKKGANGNIHRGIEPIEAYYQNSFVYFTFMDNLGELDINIYNIDNEESIYENVNSGTSTLSIDISSLGCGSHYILIEVSNGDTYWGEYYL